MAGGNRSQIMKEPKKQLDVNPGPVPEAQAESQRRERFELPARAYSVEQKASLDQADSHSPAAESADVRQPLPPQGTEMKKESLEVVAE